MKGKIISAVLMIAVFACLSVAPVKAQTPGPVIPEGTWQVIAGAGYSSTTGGALDNGSVETFQYRVHDYFAARLDAFTWGGGFLGTTARIQGQAAFSHLIKPTEFVDTSKILPFVNVGGGTVKNSAGVVKAAWIVGAGLDYRINNTLTIRAIDFSLLGASNIPNGTVTLSNIKSVSAGISLTFPSIPSAAFLQKRAARRAAKEAKRAHGK